jgi:hypothetical protein
MAQFAAAGSVLSMALANYAVDRMIASPPSRALALKFAKIEKLLCLPRAPVAARTSQSIGGKLLRIAPPGGGAKPPPFVENRSGSLGCALCPTPARRPLISGVSFISAYADGNYDGVEPHTLTITGTEIARFGTHPCGTTMPILTIRHVTAYHYKQPVAFGEHRIMLRPRDDKDQKVLETELEIAPEPSQLSWTRDV